MKLKDRIVAGLIAGSGAGVGHLLFKWIISESSTSLFVGSVISAILFVVIWLQLD